jgi:rubrerythrin
MSTNFKRTIEDFTCEHCGSHTKGNGYTNHCPNCLWSKHVDNNPGDRQSDCQGMMEPIKIDYESGEYIITHRCQKCGYEKRNKTDPNDNFQIILEIVKNLNK